MLPVYKFDIYREIVHVIYTNCYNIHQLSIISSALLLLSRNLRRPERR